MSRMKKTTFFVRKKGSSFLLSAFWDVEQPDVAKCTINNFSSEFIEWCNMSCRDFILVAMKDHTDFKIFFFETTAHSNLQVHSGESRWRNSHKVA